MDMATLPKSNQLGPAKSPDEIPGSIDTAFERTKGFSSSTTVSAAFSAIDVAQYAKEEAAFGRIDIDDRGMTAGMRLHVLEAARTSFSEWRTARAPFDQLIAPDISKIEAIDDLTDATAELQRRCDQEEAELERGLEASTPYGHVKERHENAESRFKQKFAENDQRVPTLWGYRPSYVVALAFTGIAEWFINYDVFLRFLQVPAWAAATAIILGVLLAFAAHGHGTLLKQWAFRFSRARTRAQRFTDWRLLALSTFGLLIVLSAAGGSRYAAVMRLIGSAPAVTLLGAEADIDINPVRDVLISLLGNLGAWVVGVFWAYIGHDPDPEYMEAGIEREKARRLYNRFRKKVEEEKETVRARYAQEISKKQNAAQTHMRDFERLHDLLVQVREHENVVIADLQAGLSATLHRYHDALVQIAIQQPDKIGFFRGSNGQRIAPYEFKSLSIAIDTDFVRGLT
jgi:hypothetical protein